VWAAEQEYEGRRENYVQFMQFHHLPFFREHNYHVNRRIPVLLEWGLADSNL
jgi:hypothetical protein